MNLIISRWNKCLDCRQARAMAYADWRAHSEHRERVELTPRHYPGVDAEALRRECQDYQRRWLQLRSNTPCTHGTEPRA